MKFLHLSDLHIGKRVNEVSMLDDQSDILRQILELADAERSDAESTSPPSITAMSGPSR